MSGKGFTERFLSIGQAGSALTATTTQTSLLAGVTGEQPTLPAGYFDRLGKSLYIDLRGKISNIVTTPGTLIITLNFKSAGGIDVWTTGALALNVLAKSGVAWKLSGEVSCRSIGSGTGATLFGLLDFESESYIGSGASASAGVASVLVPLTIAAGAGFDSTSAQLIDIQAKWSLSNANSINLEQANISGWSGG